VVDLQVAYEAGNMLVSFSIRGLLHAVRYRWASRKWLTSFESQYDRKRTARQQASLGARKGAGATTRKAVSDNNSTPESLLRKSKWQVSFTDRAKQGSWRPFVPCKQHNTYQTASSVANPTPSSRRQMTRHTSFLATARRRTDATACQVKASSQLLRKIWPAVTQGGWP
jgi:hypothetical protein